MAEDNEWVLESIAGYLGSPEWVIPVTDFMENRCTVFDDDDENKLSYTEIHQQYKQLVERLLENYMQEVGINEQQFLEACSSPIAKSKSLQTVFQPVLATDDFQMFRSLMFQKNVELQLQALRVIKERNGALPECLTDGADVVSELEQQEIRILQEVLKRSKEEYDLEMARKAVDEEMGSTSACSVEGTGKHETQQDTSKDPKFEVEDKSKASIMAGGKLQDPGVINGILMESSPAKKDAQNPETTLPGQSTLEAKALPAVKTPFRGVEHSSVTQSASKVVESCLEEATKEVCITRPYAEEELEQRAQYLRQQRDKLQALKKEQKPKVATPEQPAASPAPPKEEKCKRSVSGNNVPEERLSASHTSGGQKEKEISVEERKRMQKRKHLAEKLKEEVIKK